MAMTYSSRFEIGGKCLEYGDVIYFPGFPQRYVVCKTHLSNLDGNNDDIFKQLHLDPQETASKAYGYKDTGGEWPAAYSGDYRALTRLVLYLMKRCENPHAPAVIDSIYSGKTPSLMKKLSTFAKRVLDPKTNQLVKGGILDTELNLTSNGVSALLSILIQPNIDELVKVAKENIDEESKKA